MVNEEYFEEIIIKSLITTSVFIAIVTNFLFIYFFYLSFSIGLFLNNMQGKLLITLSIILLILTLRIFINLYNITCENIV